MYKNGLIQPCVKACNQCRNRIYRHNKKNHSSKASPFCIEANNMSPFANPFIRSRTFIVPDECPYLETHIVNGRRIR